MIQSDMAPKDGAGSCPCCLATAPAFNAAAVSLRPRTAAASAPPVAPPSFPLVTVARFQAALRRARWNNNPSGMQAHRPTSPVAHVAATRLRAQEQSEQLPAPPLGAMSNARFQGQTWTLSKSVFQRRLTRSFCANVQELFVVS